MRCRSPLTSSKEKRRKMGMWKKHYNICSCAWLFPVSSQAYCARNWRKQTAIRTEYLEVCRRCCRWSGWSPSKRNPNYRRSACITGNGVRKQVVTAKWKECRRAVCGALAEVRARDERTVALPWRLIDERGWSTAGMKCFGASGSRTLAGCSRPPEVVEATCKVE